MAWGPYADEDTAIRESFKMVATMQPGWTGNAVLIAVGIGWAESRFGVTKDWLLPDGITPSYNWGATVGKGTRGSVSHADHDKDGKPVRYNFSAWFTPEEGFGFWSSVWPGYRAAQDGNARGVSEAMYRKHWFTGTSGSDADRIEAYARVIVGAAQKVAKVVGVNGSGVTLGKLAGLPSGAGPPSSSGGSGFDSWGLLLLLFLLSRK